MRCAALIFSALALAIAVTIPSPAEAADGDMPVADTSPPTDQNGTVAALGDPRSLVQAVLPPLPPSGWQGKTGTKGVGGLEFVPPPFVGLGNSLSNPGFELGTIGWSLGACFALDSTIFHSGKASVRFTAGTGCGTARLLNIQSSANTYTLRGWMRSTGVNTGGQPRIGLYDSTHSGYSVTSLVGNAGTTAWQQFEIKNVGRSAGHLADRLELRLLAVGMTTGTVWFDDLELIPSLPAVSTFIRYPNYRGYLWTDKDQTIRATVEVNEIEGRLFADMRVKVSLLSAANLLPVTTVVVDPKQKLTDIAIPAKGFASGQEFLVRTELVNRISDARIAVYPDFRVVVKSAVERAAMANWFDEKNTLYHKGRPTFPWGVYDRMSSFRCTGCLGTTPAYYEKGMAGFAGLPSLLDNYADTSCNTVLYFSPFSGANPGYPSASQDQINPWIAALRSRGAMHLQITNNLYVDHPWKPSWSKGLTNDQMWRVLAGRLTDDGFLGYYTADEPDLFKVPMETVFGQYSVLRDADHNHPAYVVHFGPGALARWRDASDVFGVDPYPVGAGPLSDDSLNGDTKAPVLGRVDFYANEARAAVMDSRPLWVVLQLWTQGGKFPTYDEMRKMAWKAVVGGAKGILWWGFVSSVGVERSEQLVRSAACTLPACSPTAYDDFKRISTEVMDLESILLSDDVAGAVTCDNVNVNLRVKLFGGSYYVFTTNRKSVPITAATFRLQRTAAKNVEVYTEDRTLTPSTNAWTDGFAGHDAHVYIVTPF